MLGYPDVKVLKKYFGVYADTPIDNFESGETITDK